MLVHIEYSLVQHPAGSPTGLQNQREPIEANLEIPTQELAAVLYDCLVQNKGAIGQSFAKFSRDYQLQQESVAPGSIRVIYPAFTCLHSDLSDWQIIEASTPGRPSAHFFFYKGEHVPILEGR